MSSSRFSLALDQLGPDQWRDFELLAAEFMAVEYPSLRTMASRSGDKGRDGELFFPEEEAATTAIQYSVSSDWRKKIGATVARLSDTKPEVADLIYVTSQLIGPDADELKRTLRASRHMALDVRDKSWFIERELTSAQRQAAAAELAERYVDPLLTARGIKENVSTVLTHEEAQIALLHLTLDTEDKTSQKGLTKSCFESLVQAALEGSSSASTMRSEEILARVVKLVPSGDPIQVRALATSALTRLSSKGGPVQHHKSKDEYCLSHARVLQVKEKMATYISNEAVLEEEISERLRIVSKSLTGGVLEDTAKALRTAIEQILLDRGEGFARAVATGRMVQVDATEVSKIVRMKLGRPSSITVDQGVGIVYDVVQRPSSEVQAHLHRLADAYTVFAFLRQTPDVQKAVVKIFSGGTMWLDATVILPMLAETLLGEPADRQFTTLLRAARDAGIKLYATEGIIEEVERHINRCIAFERTMETSRSWHGRVPFLFAVHAATGRARADFGSWAREFRGDVQPEEDVADSIWDLFGVKRRNLTEYSDAAELELRAAVQEVWQEAHERRRASDLEEMSPALRARLVAHDVENCVGIMQLRKEHPSSPVGYRAWFLSMDHIAFRLVDELPARLGNRAPASPIISPDFLAEYLRVGLARTAVETEARVNLPILTDISRLGLLPLDLIEKAEKIRGDTADQSERVIRRSVRDTLDRERLRLGVTATGGLQALEEGYGAK